MCIGTKFVVRDAQTSVSALDNECGSVRESCVSRSFVESR